MASYEELVAQAEQLMQQAEAVRLQEKAGVVAEMRDKIARYGITAKELGLATVGGRSSSPAVSANARYRGPNGEVWSGKGRRPEWLRRALGAGRRKSDFAV